MTRGIYERSFILSGFFVGVIALRLGVRRVAMTGALVNSLATILGSFSYDIRHLYLCNTMAGKYSQSPALNACSCVIIEPYTSN